MSDKNKIPEAANMVLLDLFSGIGGFHKGLSDAGFSFSETYFSEIDKHAIANYKYNFPNAKYIGAVESILQSGISRPDIITFGSPCQDFSMAGKREGLNGNKSSLIQYALTAISHFRPDIFIWENVKGTFSSNSRTDFWAIIKAFANIGGYGFEWQLVNTSWLLPQNRERIYLVGHLTTAFRNWKPIFPVCKNAELCNEGKTQKSNNYPSVAKTLNANDNKSWVGNFIKQISESKESNGKQPFQQNRVYNPNGLSPCISTDHRHLNIQQLEPRTDGLSNTLTSVQKDNLLLSQSNIRKLTEIECERLQGFPDNWTQYGNYDGSIQPVRYTQRYKMLGNAVTATMVMKIGKKLIKNYL